MCICISLIRILVHVHMCTACSVIHRGITGEFKGVYPTLKFVKIKEKN